MTAWHWRASSLAGLLLTGRYRPLCAAIHAAPDCAARRAAMRALDRAFQEENHCYRVHSQWQKNCKNIVDKV